MTIISIIGANVSITTMKERFNPIWCKILIILRSINMEMSIIGTNPWGSPWKAPIVPSKNRGELIIKTTPNCIAKLPATHFIRVLFWDLVSTNPSLSNNISPTAKETIRIIGNRASIGKVPIWNKTNNILHQRPWKIYYKRLTNIFNSINYKTYIKKDWFKVIFLISYFKLVSNI